MLSDRCDAKNVGEGKQRVAQAAVGLRQAAIAVVHSTKLKFLYATCDAILVADDRDRHRAVQFGSTRRQSWQSASGGRCGFQRTHRLARAVKKIWRAGKLLFESHELPASPPHLR